VPRALQPPATQRVYDVCVIGPQLGGAVAGALLARRGWRVLQVDHGAASAGYEDQGWLLPRGPALLPAPRIWPAAEAALRELGLLADVQRALEPSPADLQLLLPRARLDLSRDPARRAAELRREWPSEAGRLEAALDELSQLFDEAGPFLAALPPLPPSGLRERWALARQLRAEAARPGARPPGEARPFAGLEGHPLARALAVAARFLASLDGELPPLAAVRLQGALLRGTHRLAGGWEGLSERMRRRLADARGEVLGAEGSPAVAEALDVDGRRVTAVRIAGSQDAFAARVFVLAADSAAVRRLLPEAERDGRAARAADRLRVRREVVSVSWVLQPGALPPGLGDTALALPGAGGEEEAILLQTSPARRAPGKGEAPEGTAVLSAAGLLASGAGEAALRDWAGRARASLADLVPFLDRHVVCESLPLLAAGGGPRGPAPDWHPLYQVEPPGPLGVTGLPTRTPWKNVLRAGREVLPGLGAEGEFHAGLQAADAAERLLGRKARPR
jgi:phytoene dehydrogenase-like protein